MKRIKSVAFITYLVLTGCSSQSQWSKTDSSEFTPFELDEALKECHFKETMKRSNQLILSSSNQISESKVPSEDKNQRVVDDYSLKKNNASTEANIAARAHSLQMASSAYECMQRKNFNRV